MASIKDQPESGASQKQSKSQKQGKREPVLIEQLCVGCIVWMPEQDGGKSARCIMPLCPCNHSELNENGSEHHLVILDVFKTDKGEVRCHVGKVTSKISKAQNFTNRIKIHQEPSASSTEKRDLDNGLYLETGELRKQSHVSLGHVYEVSPSLFSTKKGVPAYDRRLSEESYYHLMKLMGLEPATYERTKHVQKNGATTRSWIEETETKSYHSETVQARVIDLPNVSSTIGTAQRMAAFNTPVRPPPLNSQNRPISPPQDSPTSPSSVSTASSLQSPIYESPVYEQHNFHRRPTISRRGSMHSQMTHLSHAASTTTMHSSLISPGHDNTKFTMPDADARKQEDLRQRAREEEDAAEREFMEREHQRVREEVAERERQRRQREMAEMEYRRQQEEAIEREHRRQELEAMERERKRQELEAMERESQRQQEEAIEKERQRVREEVAEKERQRKQREMAEMEYRRQQEEAMERERQRQELEARERERKRREQEAIEQEHKRQQKEALERERQRSHAEYLERERQRQRQSRDSASSTEYLIKTEAAMATQHYLEKMATMEQQHPPRKEAVPPYLRQAGATTERDYSRRTNATMQSDYGRTQARGVENASTANSSSWSSSYSKSTKYTRISEYASTRITEYSRYTSEAVMYGVENAPWRTMSVGSVVVVGCYSYYSGTYEVGFEAARGVAESLRAMVGMAGRVLVKAGRAFRG